LAEGGKIPNKKWNGLSIATARETLKGWYQSFLAADMTIDVVCIVLHETPTMEGTIKMQEEDWKKRKEHKEEIVRRGVEWVRQGRHSTSPPI
jgi:hypothetical protein